LSFDENEQLVGEGDMEVQTRTIFEHLRRSLAAAGATPADVVRIKVYTTDIESFKLHGQSEYLAFFEGDERPVSTAVQVSALADPRCLVEIEVDAELD
jgi:enamine deaminase RidA (YjgF/YER057c/UK114 family)